MELSRLVEYDRLLCRGYTIESNFFLYVVPKLFYQLYSIHGHIHGRTFPFLYAFLPGKSNDIYSELFDVVLQHIDKHPASITIDFEIAATNVTKQKFPSTAVTACFFHFKQNLWRKTKVSLFKVIQQIGLFIYSSKILVVLGFRTDIFISE